MKPEINAPIFFKVEPRSNNSPVRLPVRYPFYVYFHRKMTDGEIFYVGKGRGNRAWSVDGRTRAWVKVVADHGRIVEIYRDNLPEALAGLHERDQIAFLLSIGQELVNVHHNRKENDHGHL